MVIESSMGPLSELMSPILISLLDTIKIIDFALKLLSDLHKRIKYLLIHHKYRLVELAFLVGIVY